MEDIRPSPDMDPIVVIGFDARLPQDACSAQEFWKMLYRGRNATTSVPKERVNMDAFYHPNPDRTDTANVRTGNFITGDIGAFDAPFFSIQQIEAESMDPQQRLLLETSYRALENSGTPLDKIQGSKTSVYVAASTRDYEVILYRDPELTPKYMGTGIGTSLLANRVSWFFDLRGPSIALDTACSSGLAAVHLACQSLKSGESNLALVGGVSLILAPEVNMNQLSTLGFLSPDGRSYSFDSRANGYAKGEGVCVVVLKRLSDAIRDNDTIRGVIRATTINQDGRTPGITQPSRRAQTENIRRAYEEANLDLNDTHYFEAHGTGTAVGDPLEAEAIHNAFQRPPDRPLWIGALKANIGHLEAAAGVASLIKAVLVLEKGILPPNADFQVPNPNIPIDKYNFKFLKSPMPFPTDGLRRMSINNFGYGGTNTHAIVDDAFNYLRMHGLRGKHFSVVKPPQALDNPQTSTSSHSTSQETANTGNIENTNGYHNGSSPVKTNGHPNGHRNGNSNGNSNGNGHTSFGPGLNRPIVLPFSSADESGIERTLKTYQEYFSKLEKEQSVDEEREYLQNLSYTLSTRRSNLPWKSFSVVSSMDQLRSGDLIASKPQRSSAAPSLSFVFTGQGAQWYAMGRELSLYLVYFESMRRSDSYMKDLGCPWSLIDELHKDVSLSLVSRPEYSQPLCTALQIALVDLLDSWDIKPVAVVGHSSGEIAAAYCAGGLSHKSAIRAAFYRGLLASQLLKEQPNSGAMISVALSETEIQKYSEEAMQRTGETLFVGCVNSPQNVTVTGGTNAVEALSQLMQNEGVFARTLSTGIAYHSRFMDAISAEYLAKLGKLEPGSMSGNSPLFFSSVDGAMIPVKNTCSPTYWVRNLVGQVAFLSALQDMTLYLLEERKKNGSNKSGKDILLEIGPHGALQRPIKETVKDTPGARDIDYIPTLTRNMHALVSISNLTGRLRCSGIPVDLLQVNFPNADVKETRALIDLPAYKFNHSTKYWQESRLSRNFRFRQHQRHELLGNRETDWNPLRPKWRNVIRLAENGWILDHQLDKSHLYPASGMLVMVIEAARSLAGSQSVSGYFLSNVNFPAGLRIPQDVDSVEAQIIFNPVQPGMPDQCRIYDFQIFAYFGEAWHELCHGTIETKINDGKVIQEGVQTEVERQRLQKLLNGESNQRWDEVNSKEFYEAINEYGMSFGPAFQGLQEVRVASRQATAKIELDKWNRENAKFTPTPHIIHPTDLDTIFQSSIAAFSHGGRLPIPVLIPQKIRSIWVSHELLGRSTKETLKVFNNIETRGYREADFSIAAVNEQRRPQVLVNGLSLTFVKDARWMERADQEARRTCWSLAWKPDPSFLTSKDLIDMCASDDKAATAASLVELFAYQNPIMGILEAGDVPVATSQKIRDRLTNYGLDIDGKPSLPLFRTYTITNSQNSDTNDDTNSESDRLIRRTLDTANNFDEQGFIDCHYDLLICNDRKYLLTAAPEGLSNIKNLLEPNAKILLLDEFVVLSKADLDNLEDFPSDQAQFVNGDLSSLSTSGTSSILESAGSGSTIIIAPNSDLQRGIAEVLRRRLLSKLGSPDIVTLEDISPAQYEGRHYISLLELDGSVFQDISNNQWAMFKQILSTAKSLLWMTKGQSADKSLVSGLGRVIQSEYLDLRFVEVALETSTSKDRATNHILSVLQKTLLAEDVDLETEYREKDGKLCLGRISETTTVNSMIRSSTGLSRPSIQQFGADTQRVLNLSITSPGLLDTLQFEDDPDYALALGPTEVEIEVRSTGMNFKDILIAMGQISGNRLGFECSGIVSRAGPQAGFTPGERVSCCTLSGAYKTFVRTDASWVIRLPDNIPYVDAASIPLVFATAYYSLVTVARLSENETVLIHSGAGGVGQAAIQIAQRINAKIFTTVGSPDKKELLQDLYGIPESHIFNSRDTTFAEGLQKHCPDGVDVVLNSLRGELQEASWKCIAPLGRFVDVGKADFESSRKGLNMKPFLTNVSFSSVDLSIVMEKAKPVMAKIMSAIRDHMTDAVNPITPPQPLQVYQVGNLKDAFRHMASGKSSGKIVLDMKPTNEVPIVPSRCPRYNFDPNATYVIGGGLGGLGQTLVDWMVGRKARHFILLSRSGAAKNEAAQEMIARHTANGIEIKAPSCDVADEDAVRAVFEGLSQTMPPIKGCIQGSMVLRDGLLSSMSAADWNAVLRPKTQGTLNLAAHLPQDMDFFVLLSSISAISGSRCQANYSAANSYMDALAQDLVAQGRRCLSLNLGVIKDVGIAAQLGTNAALRRDGFEGLTTPELLALLDYACDPKCPRATHPQSAQLIAGLGAAMTLPSEHFESVYWTRRPMFRQLQEVNRITFQNADSGGAKSAKGADNFGRLLADASDETAAADVALKGLVNKLAKLLNVPETDVETRTPLHSFGIDSLVALEIRYWVSKELKTELSIFDIMQAGGLADLAGVIAQKSEARTKQ